MKAVAPDSASEKQVVVSADADMPYGTLVTTIDTLQADELFPEVMFGITR